MCPRYIFLLLLFLTPWKDFIDNNRKKIIDSYWKVDILPSCSLSVTFKISTFLLSVLVTFLKKVKKKHVNSLVCRSFQYQAIIIADAVKSQNVKIRDNDMHRRSLFHACTCIALAYVYCSNIASFFFILSQSLSLKFQWEITGLYMIPYHL